MAEVSLKCPQGHVELTVTGSHGVIEDLEHIEGVALREDYDKVPNRGCPACGRVMRLMRVA